MKLNYFSLNTTLLGLSRLNNNVVKRRNTTVIPPSPSRPEGLIGQYKPYLNSNDSPTRSTLKDYSGLGNDIILYNFLYALGSGYGLYKADLNAGKTYNNTSGTDVQILERTSSKLIIKEIKITSRSCIYTYNSTSDGSLSPTNRECPSYKVKISNLPENTLEYQYISEDGLQSLDFKLHEGINVLPKSYAYIGNRPYITHGFNILSTAQTGECNIIIEQIPDYPGALVSDGVDDYGLCETPFGEVGTVIIMLDEVKWDNDKYLYGANSSVDNGRIFCNKTSTGDLSVGLPNTSISLENKFIHFIREPKEVTDKFNLCCNTPGSRHSSTAIYAMELYSKKLTDEEIESVKEAMYNEYLTATNALQNHIIADYECYDKTNEDEDRDVLKDLSGNGHDITLYNFGFAEGSGYGLYKENCKSSGTNGGSYGVTHVKTYNSISVSVPASISNNFYLSKIREVGERINFKILVSGIPEGVTLEASLLGSPSRNFNLINGVNVIDITRLETDGNRLYFTYRGLIDTPYTITVKEIPEYQGALVSDGVDDYGLCENFPILNKEDGYTVLAIRKIPEEQFSKSSSLIAKGTLLDFSESEFAFDFNYKTNKFGAVNFAWLNNNLIEAPEIFSYQTSKLYNGKSLIQNDLVPTESNKLGLFRYVAGGGGCGTYALYRAIILDKDCTTEEIKFLAKQMVARHKEKTGETITLNI